MNLQFLIALMERTVESEALGQWRVNPTLAHIEPNQTYGFVYCIENTETGKLYIGRKQTVHKGKKSSRIYGKETKWRSYQGSSKHLTADIKELGEDVFLFHILEYYYTRGGLNYGEVEWQTKCDSLTAKTPDGERLFYNAQIGAVRWIPKETWEWSERAKALQSESLKGNRNRACQYEVFKGKKSLGVVKNLAGFCRENGLDKSNLIKTAQGLRKTHKGFSARKEKEI
jgi:hypothetical protein